MRKTIIGMTLATAIATTSGTQVSAATDQERLGQFLFGAMALFVLSQSLDDKGTITSKPKPKPVIVKPPRKVLPARCLQRISTDSGNVRMFGKRCLQRHYTFADSIPRKCEIKVRNLRDKVRKGYKPRCLKKRGYRMSSN